MKEELHRMEQEDIRAAVPENLVDISNIEIDMKNYLILQAAVRKQRHSPYHTEKLHLTDFP